jgi:hypothetical protein
MVKSGCGAAEVEKTKVGHWFRDKTGDQVIANYQSHCRGSLILKRITLQALDRMNVIQWYIWIYIGITLCAMLFTCQPKDL